MCEEAANTFLFILTMFLIDIRLIKCVKNLLMLMFSITVCARLLQDSRNVKKAVDGYSFTNMSLIDIRPKKCVKMLLMVVLLH